MPTRHCKTCFKIINCSDFYEVFKGDSCLCEMCQQKLKPLFIKFEIEGIDGLTIYDYDDNIKSLLYQFKGCYDIELANVFLNRFKKELNVMYQNYILLPAPSYYLKEEKRGFNHVNKIFEVLNLPIINVFSKTAPFKQAEHTKKDRAKIGQFFVLNKPNEITNKNVLIVDDVYTTGATMKALVRLVKTMKPKKIKILVMAKRLIH